MTTTNTPPLVLDIETVPMTHALTMPYPEQDRTPPANYKSDEAIAKWREKDKAEWQAARVKECSLNPRLGRIVCIGMRAGEDEQIATARTEAEEKHVLRAFWEACGEAQGRVVTWNGSWDLRFILMRTIFHQMPMDVMSHVVREWFRKYSSYPHFDCKAVLTNWDAPRAGEGLTEWAEFLGLDGKIDGMKGSDVFGLVQQEQWQQLEEYCMADVRATAAVYHTIAPYF